MFFVLIDIFILIDTIYLLTYLNIKISLWLQAAILNFRCQNYDLIQ